MLRVEIDCVLRIEEGEEDREGVAERWKGGGWRERGVRPKGSDILVLEKGGLLGVSFGRLVGVAVVVDVGGWMIW